LPQLLKALTLAASGAFVPQDNPKEAVLRADGFLRGSGNPLVEFVFRGLRMRLFYDWVEFLKAVVINWAAYATGGIVVATLGLWSTVRQIPISRKIGIVAALFFLLVAFFHAWREQRDAAVSARVQLEAESKPSIALEVTQMLSAEFQDGTQAFIAVDVRNSAAPSAIYGWQLYYPADDKSAQPISPTVIPDGYQIIMNGQLRGEFHADNRLEERTREPIVQGQRVGGWLRFVLPKTNAKEFASDTTSKKLVCMDVYKHQWSTSFKRLSHEGLQYYPEAGTNPFKF
jgi:hypothetical protein